MKVDNAEMLQSTESFCYASSAVAFSTGCSLIAREFQTTAASAVIGLPK